MDGLQYNAVSEIAGGECLADLPGWRVLCEHEIGRWLAGKARIGADEVVLKLHKGESWDKQRGIGDPSSPRRSGDALRKDLRCMPPSPPPRLPRERDSLRWNEPHGTEEARFQERVALLPKTPSGKGLPARGARFALPEPVGPTLERAVRISQAVLGQLLVADHPVRPEVGHANLQAVLARGNGISHVEQEGRLPEEAEILAVDLHPGKGLHLAQVQPQPPFGRGGKRAARVGLRRSIRPPVVADLEIGLIHGRAAKILRAGLGAIRP